MSGIDQHQSPAGDTQAAILLSAVDEGLAAIDPLGDAARASAASFRQFDLRSGTGELASLAQNLGSLLVLTNTLVSVFAHGGEARVGVDGTASDLSPFADCVNAIIAAQASQDWIRLADILEYETTATLETWATVLRQMRRQIVTGLHHA